MREVDFLKGQVGSRPDVTFYNADSNQVMLESVLPRFSYAKTAHMDMLKRRSIFFDRTLKGEPYCEKNFS